jgi:hypothetical protein
MRTDDFWAVIARATADRPATPDEVAKHAVAELAGNDPEEIVAWGRHLDKVMADVAVVRGAADTGAVFEAAEVLSIAAEAYQQATGQELPAEDRPATRPDVADLWDFDDEEEMQRRLPKLSALFLAEPE